jgi:PIN domain nuclease of toxin-antitoxin system
LAITLPLSDFPPRLQHMGIGLIDVRRAHVLHELDPLPPTNDPFDRLLLAVAAVEGASLVTVDDKLADHPLVWRQGTA